VAGLEVSTEVATVRQDEFRSEVVEIAREECRARGITVAAQGQFSSMHAEVAREGSGFCRKCFEATTNESPGSTFTLSFFFGTRLHDDGDECPDCGSVRASKWLWVLVPVARLGRYRIRYRSQGSFFSEETGLVSGEYVGRRTKGG
jgi:hypothetical protein